MAKPRTVAETLAYVLGIRSGLMAFPNQGGLDRALRFAAGLVILGFGWFGPVEGLAGVACRILGWYPLITSVVGWSPLYAVLGLDTRRRPR